MFSVVIPVYNKFPHLERSINSVLNQTYKNFELILIDDASTDGSSDKIEEFKDPRIRVLKREIPGPGGYAARNAGIQSATFEWISFLDADDEWDPAYLLEVNKQILKYPKAEVISSNYQTLPVDRTYIVKMGDGLEANPFTFVDYLYNRGLMWTSAITIKRSLLIESGLFPVGKCKRGGDLDTWIRCLNKSEQNLYINEILAFYYRDSVNRVTDEKSNPPAKFCSLETLKSLKADTQDVELKNAIDFFIRTSIYSLLGVRVKMGYPIDYTLIKELNPVFHRLTVVFKLVLIRVKYKFIA